MTVHWLNRDELFEEVKRRIDPAGTVLDIGCGIRPQSLTKPNVHICCEPFDQYVSVLTEKIENNKDRFYVIIKASWSDAVRLFPKGGIDTIFLLDVIEHLDKEEASALLKETVDISRQQVVLFTPLGFFPQSHPDKKDAWGLDGGEWQEHKSGWFPEDFDDSWDIYASKEFHCRDPKGELLDKPFGAFFAILNNNKKKTLQKKKANLSRRQKAHWILDEIIDPVESVLHRIR
jgi:hypothetical protein